jgi:nucleotide-binding universal stress UspA family protein
MSTSTSTRTQLLVVVGTDGSPAALHGVRWAAREARRLGTGLLVAHATPGYLPTGPVVPMIPDGSLREYGAELLQRSSAVAREEVPDLAVDGVLVEGGRVAGLVGVAKEAALLVLGTEHRPLMERVWTGTTVTGVAARASCPVVVVRAEAPDSAGDGGVEHGRIVVGWKTAAHARELLAAGFALARSRSAELVVVRAWKLAPYYDDVVSDRVGRAEWRARETELIEEVLGDFRERYPDVRIRVDVVHEQPAAALVAASASASADRLLLVRRVHGGALHHLGPVARAVLRESRCAVEVLAPSGPADHDTEVSTAHPGLAVELDGALQR